MFLGDDHGRSWRVIVHNFLIPSLIDATLGPARVNEKQFAEPFRRSLAILAHTIQVIKQSPGIARHTPEARERWRTFVDVPPMSKGICDASLQAHILQSHIPHTVVTPFFNHTFIAQL